MPFGHVVDIDSLVAPVNEDTPQGIDIREDRSPTSDYYTIKDARNAARAAERSAARSPLLPGRCAARTVLARPLANACVLKLCTLPCVCLWCPRGHHIRNGYP